MDDAGYIVPLANNINIAKNLRDRFPHPYSIDDAHNFLDHVIDEDPPKILAIIYKDEFAGTVGIVKGEDIHYRTAEIGYWLGEKYWGKGIMSEVVKTASKHFMETFNLTRIFALPKEDNIASHRVLEKAGYVLEGIQRRHYEKFGKIGDSHLYAYV